MRNLFEHKRQALALTEALSELQADFPRTRRIPGVSALELLDTLDSLSKSDKGDLIRGLVCAAAHPCIRDAYPLSSRQQELVRAFRESNYRARHDVWSTAGKGPRSLRTTLRKEVQPLMRAAFPLTRENWSESKVLSYQVQEAAWTVNHIFDFGKSSAYMACHADVFWPAFPSPFGPNFSLMTCLGVAGETAWTHVDEGGIEEAAARAVEMAIHFGQSIAELLKDLPAPTPEDYVWRPRRG